MSVGAAVAFGLFFAVVAQLGDLLESQMKRADAVGARLALIIGEDEVAADTVSVKHLREEGQQVSVGSGALNDYLAKVFV